MLLWTLSKFWIPAKPLEIRRIVVMELTRLGDVIASTAMSKPLKVHFPQATQEWWVGQDYLPLIPQGTEGRGIPTGTLAFLRAAWCLRKKLQDPELLIVVVSPALKHSLLCFFSRPARLLGYAFPGFWDSGYHPKARVQDWSAGNRTRSEALDGQEHMVLRGLKVFQTAGIPTSGYTPALFADQKSEQTVLMHPGANWQWRRWPLVNFIELGKKLNAAGIESVLVADRDSLKDAGESIDTLRLKAQGLNIFVPQTLESLKKVCAEAH